jgi:hypothetical protein
LVQLFYLLFYLVYLAEAERAVSGGPVAAVLEVSAEAAASEVSAEVAEALEAAQPVEAEPVVKIKKFDLFFTGCFIILFYVI